MKVGLNTHFEYARVKHVLDISVWYNTGLGAESTEYNNKRDPFSYRLTYRNLVGRDAYIFWDTRILDGIFYDNLGFEKSFGKNKMTFRYKSISMLDGKSIYWPYANTVNREDKTNSSINIDYQRNYRYKKGNGVINSSLRGNGLNKDYAYGAFKFEVINHSAIGKLDIHTRWFFQHIEGSAIPEEFMLNLAGANMEDMLESKFTRSRGFIPQQWLGYGATTNHFQMGGGLNLRGYAGYLAPVTVNNVQYNLFQGTGGTSASIEVDFDRLVRFRPKLTRNFLKMDVYAFGDAGVLYNNNITPDGIGSPLRMDAGLGTALSVYRWGKRNLIQPLTLRFDMPFLLNTQPFADKGYFQNRWVFGIGRSF
jgi:aminopeptidase N